MVSVCISHTSETGPLNGPSPPTVSRESRPDNASIEPAIEGASPCLTDLATSHRCWRRLPQRLSALHQLPQPMRTHRRAPAWAVRQPNAKRPAMFKSTTRLPLFTTSLNGTTGTGETQYRRREYGHASDGHPNGSRCVSGSPGHAQSGGRLAPERFLTAVRSRFHLSLNTLLRVSQEGDVRS